MDNQLILQHNVTNLYFNVQINQINNIMLTYIETYTFIIIRNYLWWTNYYKNG